MYAFGNIIARYAFKSILCGKFDGWRAIEVPLETPAECKTAATFAAAVSSKCCRLSHMSALGEGHKLAQKGTKLAVIEAGFKLAGPCGSHKFAQSSPLPSKSSRNTSAKLHKPSGNSGHTHLAHHLGQLAREAMSARSSQAIAPVRSSLMLDAAIAVGHHRGWNEQSRPFCCHTTGAVRAHPALASY